MLPTNCIPAVLRVVRKSNEGLDAGTSDALNQCSRAGAPHLHVQMGSYKLGLHEDSFKNEFISLQEYSL